MKQRLGYLAMLLFLLLAAAGAHYLARAGDREQIPPHASLAEFPRQLDSWRQTDAQALSAGTLRELKADDYLSAVYANDRGAFASLFIAYYGSQRHRQTIHSPQNCLPGAGWTMSRHRLHAMGERGQINEYLIEKDDVQTLAFYWYQARGRTVASEYWARFDTMRDAMWRGRTDGALVRVIVPMGKGDGAEEFARAVGLDFSQKLLTILPGFVPD
jgi:EpsI family protein